LHCPALLCSLLLQALFLMSGDAAYCSASNRLRTLMTVIYEQSGCLQAANQQQSVFKGAAVPILHTAGVSRQRWQQYLSYVRQESQDRSSCLPPLVDVWTRDVCSQCSDTKPVVGFASAVFLSVVSDEQVVSCNDISSACGYGWNACGLYMARGRCRWGNPCCLWPQSVSHLLDLLAFSHCAIPVPFVPRCCSRTCAVLLVYTAHP
jgi:hypothetical protein